MEASKKIKISSSQGLQIGNLVYNIHGEIHAIRANDFSRFNHPDMGGDYGLYAIELSPEILEKCGFALNGFKQYEIQLPKTLSCSNRKLFFANDYLYLEEVEIDPPRPIKRDTITIWNKDLMKQFYLHDLQNVFYSFTKTELPITLI